MKKQYKLLIVLMILICSCSKFLDRPLENQTNATGINYADLSTMYQPVSGVYRTAAKANPGLVHWVDLGMRAVRGDEFDKGSSPGDQSPLADIKSFSYGGLQAFWGLNNSWNDYYGLVIDCNSALLELNKFAKNIPSGDAKNTALYNQYSGEVRFIRAFAHLMASRVFGNVPVLTNNDSLTTVAKKSAADVRRFIISEMDAIIPNLEDARPNQSAHVGSVTKYSALLLKAKAAADLAGNDNGSSYWDAVIDATNQIISSSKFTLYSDFYQLFKMPGKLCNESLFELQYTDFGDNTSSTVAPDAFWPFQGPGGDQKGSPISGWGFMPPTQKIVDFLTARNDLVRLKTTIQYCGVNGAPGTFVVTPSGDKVYGNSNGTKYFNGKAYLPANQMTADRTDYGSNNNVRVLRYSDALLLNAEAKVRKGQNGDASLNLVRSRAGLVPLSGASLQNILDERRAEFACEWWGERFNDLLRTGQAAATLPNFVSGQSDYLPIPQSQIDLNPNLK
ncbi:MAG: RagB/SusD family nutrient uptake outer membrane protein [Niabella sp.]|nr:RagB/SusD family nutrient uptake outer membrane protein [Niabella sp.]